jgi:hypothetical protein
MGDILKVQAFQFNGDLSKPGHLEDALTRRLGSLRYVRLFQKPVAAEVTRLKLQAFQGKWSLLTSAATILQLANVAQPSWLRVPAASSRRFH